MIARIRKSMQEKDQGFTLVELLVVMIIIGILAAIAIPIFMNQRKKAVDSAATSDVSTLGKEVATYYVDATAVLPTANLTRAGNPARYTLTPPGTGATAQDLGKSSNGVTAVTLSYGNQSSVTQASTTWCVTVTYEGGTRTSAYYSAANGLSTTGCN